MSIKQKNTTKSLDLYTTRCLSKKFSKTTQINYIFLCLIINYTVTNNHIGCVFTRAKAETVLPVATFFQDICSEGFYVIARANARSNPAFANFARSEIG